MTSKVSNKLVCICFADNHKGPIPIFGFLGFSKSNENALKRKARWIRQIKNNQYKNWSGAERVHFIDRCKENAWDIRVEVTTLPY
jgi:hypothetical protein